ncbi:MAG: energy transducer TonB [Bacteroidales bacterium]
MTIKKTEQANMERNKSTFFLLGTAIVLSFVLIAFEWSTNESSDNPFLNAGWESFDVEEIPLTIEKEKEPEPIQIPVFAELINIISDTALVTSLFDLFSGDPGDLPDLPPFIHNPVPPDTTPLEPDYYVSVEEMPKFREGDLNKFNQWVNERIRYPELPRQNGIQGRVIVAFMIEPDGSVSNVKIIKGVDYYLDEEAIRVVTSSPAWTPGKQNARPVRVRFSIPIYFRLQ